MVYRTPSKCVNPFWRSCKPDAFSSSALRKRNRETVQTFRVLYNPTHIHMGVLRLLVSSFGITTPRHHHNHQLLYHLFSPLAPPSPCALNAVPLLCLRLWSLPFFSASASASASASTSASAFGRCLFSLPLPLPLPVSAVVGAHGGVPEEEGRQRRRRQCFRGNLQHLRVSQNPLAERGYTWRRRRRVQHEHAPLSPPCVHACVLVRTPFFLWLCQAL